VAKPQLDIISQLAQLRSETRATDFRDPDNGPKQGYVFVGYMTHPLKTSQALLAKVEGMHNDYHNKERTRGMGMKDIRAFMSGKDAFEDDPEHDRLVALIAMAQLAWRMDFDAVFPKYSAQTITVCKGGAIYAVPQESKPKMSGMHGFSMHMAGGSSFDDMVEEALKEAFGSRSDIDPSSMNGFSGRGGPKIMSILLDGHFRAGRRPFR